MHLYPISHHDHTDRLQQGYEGRLCTVTRYISSRPATQGLPAKVECSPRSTVRVYGLQSSPCPARRASYLVITRQENRDSEEQALIEKLIAHPPNLQSLLRAAMNSYNFSANQGEAFNAWVSKALKSSLQPFQAFAEGLLNAYDAVTTSMTLNISNGLVAGLTNRLKRLKRQMYRRAGLALLNKRCVLAA